jgi:superfamily II DNA helicase RecQ
VHDTTVDSAEPRKLYFEQKNTRLAAMMSSALNLSSASSTHCASTITAQSEISDNELRQKIKEVLGKRPCDFQFKLYKAQQSGKNIISVARTGSGKTLTYFMPLVTSLDGIIIIVTALNVLGEQFEREARAAGFSAKSVNSENDNDEVFTVCKSIAILYSTIKNNLSPLAGD